jgi:hypothetical protein
VTPLHTRQAYVKEQIAQYQEYLQQCREQHYRPTSSKLKGSKKSKKAPASASKTMAGPFKFSYKDLQKQVRDSFHLALNERRAGGPHD